MIGRIMNISGAPYLDFGYKDNQQQGKKKKEQDFGDILANEIKKEKNRLTIGDASTTQNLTRRKTSKS